MIEMNQKLPSAALRQAYERDGYVSVRSLVDEELRKECHRHIEWLLEKHPDLRPEHLNNMVHSDPFWVRLCGDDRLLDVAEQFIGPNIALFASHYFAKPPGDGQAVLWHQDGSYWALDPMRVVTLWVALDNSTRENGCMRVIPGTHTDKLNEMKQRTDVPNVLSSGMDESRVDESKAVDLELKAGDASVHHPNLIHGSLPNRSTTWRRGLTIRYIPTTTRYTKPPSPSAYLLRGKAVAGLNEYHLYPKYVPGEHMSFRGCERWVCEPRTRRLFNRKP